MEFVQAGLPCNVGEYYGSVVHEAAGGDGTVLRVLHGFMGTGSGDAHWFGRRLIFLLGEACGLEGGNQKQKNR